MAHFYPSAGHGTHALLFRTAQAESNGFIPVGHPFHTASFPAPHLSYPQKDAADCVLAALRMGRVHKEATTEATETSLTVTRRRMYKVL